MTVRIGLMGFGRIGRQIYQLAMKDDQLDVVVISDIGDPQILCHLLDVTLGHTDEIRLEGNYLVGDNLRTRMMSANEPGEVPWDVFDIDVVIDVTGKFRSRAELTPHLDSGAKRVVSSVLPADDIDRVILAGVNEKEAQATDRIVSAGSGSTTGTALIAKLIGEKLPIAHVTMTTVHAYTSDQSLQDYAAEDYRRSRSGAENIIPNITPALDWVQRLVPAVSGKLTAYALNVPVQAGSMLDITLALTDEAPSIDEIRGLLENAAKEMPEIIETTHDQIVSSDVRGNTHSLLIDLDGSMIAGTRMVKILAWYESRSHAARILDLVKHYDALDNDTDKGERAA